MHVSGVFFWTIAFRQMKLINLSMLSAHDLQYAFCSQYCSWGRSHCGRHYDCASYTVFARFGCTITQHVQSKPSRDFALSRDVEAEAGNGPFSVEGEARKFYRFRFHIGYLTWRVTWPKIFVHFPMLIKRWSCTISLKERAISVARENEIKHN